MSEDARQSLIAWGSVAALFGAAWLAVGLGIRFPDWLRDSLITLVALNACWQVYRMWRRRGARAQA